MFKLLLILIILFSVAFGYIVLRKIETYPHIITYTRDGDIWLAKTDGTGESKITSHEQISYKYRNYINGEFIENNLSNKFYKSTKISSDGKYIFFLSLSDNYLDELNDWKDNVKFFSNYNPNYSEFDPPEISYELKIFDLISKKITPLTSYKSEVKHYGKFNSLMWAKNRDSFVFVKDFNLHFLFNIKMDIEKPSLETYFLKDFCSLDCGLLSDEDQFIKLSPDGAKLLTSYQFPDVSAGCNNTVGSKIMVFDFETKRSFLIPVSSDYCSGNIGDWFSDSLNYITVEYNLSTGSDNFIKRNYGDDYKEFTLFQDKDYQFRGPLSISPDDKWVIYPVGEHTFGSIGRTDLRLRSLTTSEYFDILPLLNKNLNLNMARAMYPNWDSNSKYVYLELEGDSDPQKRLILKFDIKKKKGEVLFNNAGQPSISN